MTDNVLYSCGHTAPRTKAFEPWHKCPDCHRVSDGATKRNQEAGLPELDGTDKQKRWAESLRDKARRSLEKLVSDWEKVNAPHADRVVSQLKKLVSQILQEKGAPWWIERKDADWEKVVFDGILREK